MSNELPDDTPEGAETQPATGGEYTVVARRYRPQSFTELVGQDQVSQALASAITSNRVGHAYLFTGARGVGKTSTARILAKALNCKTGPTTSPCNECDVCQSITAGDDVDVLEIDGASNRGIDEIRQLRSNVNIRPSRTRYKIYIIDEVHMLTTQAFNALLKTLEEPPEHVKFIFCTTDPEKIPITVLSRCQRFDFLGIRSESIMGRLRHIVDVENVDAEDAALELIARRANGSMRDSQSLLEQLLSFGGQTLTLADVHQVLGTAGAGQLATLSSALQQKDAATAIVELDKALSQGVDEGQLMAQLVGYFRDLMAVCVGCPAEGMLNVSPDDYDSLKAAAGEIGLETCLAALQILDHTLLRMRQSTHGRTLAEMALVRVCNLERLDDLTNTLGQVASGQPITIAATSPAASPVPASPAVAPSAPSPPISRQDAPPSSPATPPAEKKK